MKADQKQKQQIKMLKKYAKDRDEMLLKYDINALREFVNKHADNYTPNSASDEFVELVLHKMIVHAIRLPTEFRAKAEWWLVERGYSTEIS